LKSTGGKKKIVTIIITQDQLNKISDDLIFLTKSLGVISKDIDYKIANNEPINMSKLPDTLAMLFQKGIHIYANLELTDNFQMPIGFNFEDELLEIDVETRKWQIGCAEFLWNEFRKELGI